MTSAPTDNVDAATGIALIRRPGPRLAEGIVSHIKRSQVDVDLAGDQWLAYVAALEQAGWSTYEVEPPMTSPTVSSSRTPWWFSRTWQ